MIPTHSPCIKGDSAYTVAVQEGFVGTKPEWLLSLKGEPGSISTTQIATIVSQVPIPDISGKVDKVTGSALVPTTEIAKIHSPGSDNQNLSNLVVKETGKSLINDLLIHAPGSDNQDLSELQPKESGKGLSTNDLTVGLKTNYDGAVTHAGSSHAPSNAQKNSDITKAEIEAKLTGELTSHTHAGSGLTLGELSTNAYYGDKGKAAYDHSQTSHANPAATVGADWNTNVSNKPTIPAAQVQTDWNASSGMGQLLNKPTISGSNTGDETAARIATIITGTGAQTTPLDADEFPFYKIVGTILSKVTWANIKATLKTYFDTLHNSIRLFINLIAAVVSSGTTEKILLQLQIPAARAVVGSTFRMRIIGNSSSTGTLIFKVRCGAGGTITDAIAWTAITSAAQVANARAGFEAIVIVRSATTLYTDGLGHAAALNLPTFVAAPATSVIAISGIWYINLTVICSSGTFTAQVGTIEEIR
jgi:hypothetical protein